MLVKGAPDIIVHDSLLSLTLRSEDKLSSCEIFLYENPK